MAGPVARAWMPTLGPGIFEYPARAGGFTLIEILVVVAVLAIAAGLAFVSLDGDERGMVARESRRLAGAIEYAAARAQMRSETLGISAQGRRWHFWVKGRDMRWIPLADDEALAPHTMPAPLTARAVSYAGRALDEEAIVPLRPSGRNEPFAFAMGTSALRAVLASDPLNRVTITGPAPVAQ